MTGSTKAGAVKANPTTKEWGRKARKAESKTKRRAVRQAAIREAREV